ncbi:MAG: ankyrin repeat domain-containing protein, partial [Candidatus Methylomirabilis oxyfera]|nr:ankyrin repeat domain-containing protein [Candidatus Methylomirabilis oxyfera]
MGFLSSLFEGSGKPVDRLIEASKSGDIEKVKRLLAEGADVNARDTDGWTALTHASW